MKKIITIGLIYFSMIGSSLNAQHVAALYIQPLSFDRFLYLVAQNNLEYAAERFNVQISEASVELAKLWPNPYFSFDWIDYREDQSRSGHEFTSELGTTVELGGKRKARVNLARSEKELTQSMLDDYFRNLRAEAAIIYLEAVKQNQFYGVLLDSYLTMKKLAEADSIRLSLGSIMEIDAFQSKLEAGILLNELLQKEADQQNSFNQLNLLAGTPESDTLFSPVDSMKKAYRDFYLDTLVLNAQQYRADLEAARYNMEVSARAADLARKERRLDMDLRIGFGNEYYVPNTLPHTEGFAAGVAIPLKFSNFNKGDLKIAHFQEQKAEKYFSYILLKIRIEIVEAYQNYISTNKQVRNFENNLLSQSEDVLNGKIYSYQRGETSLLEVLNAQRTYNEIRTTYIEIVHSNYIALVELEKAAGIWDIEF